MSPSPPRHLRNSDHRPYRPRHLKAAGRHSGTPARVLTIGVIGLLVVVALLGAAAMPLQRTTLSPGQAVWSVKCNISHSAPADPIVFPAQPGRSYVRDFFGNDSITAHATTSSLLRAGSSCRNGMNEVDKSAYGTPALVYNGHVVKAPADEHYIDAYYSVSDKPLPVRPMPVGLRMIAGNPRARSPQPTEVVHYDCLRYPQGGPVTASSAAIPTCPAGSHLSAVIVFPGCWDGRNLDSRDHRSHVAYPVKGHCPSSHSVRLPTLAIRVQWTTARSLPSSQLALASGGQFTMHADFWNAWHPSIMKWLVENCLNASRTCTDIPRRQISVPTDTLPSGVARPSSSTTPPSTTPQTSASTTPRTSASTTPQTSAQPATPGHTNPSGLAWSSGAVGDGLAGFASWRGRPLDNTTTWPNRANWNEISHPDIYGAISSQPAGITLSLGLAMLPDPANGASFAACATGAYDSYYRTYGSELVRLGRADSIVRLGWEANGDWYSWSIGSNVASYKACFRRQVAAIRSTDPRVRIDWNMNKDSNMDVSVAEAYPGNDMVDIVGVDFYDMWPAYPDQAAWSTDYMRTEKGGPRGLGAWLAFAKTHGKRLSVPEWGTSPDRAGGGGDHPVYIQGMNDFFTEHAADIAYETYFNIHSGFRLWPSTVYPRSAAEYRSQF